MTNEVNATRRESGEIRVLLGRPGNGYERSTCYAESRSEAVNVVTMPRFVRRHISLSFVA